MLEEAQRKKRSGGRAGNATRRGTAVIDQMSWRLPINTDRPIEPLRPEGVQAIHAIRTRKGIADADIVVVRFGDQYKQWNAAFDAGYAAALGKSLIILHGPDHQHALKEVDAAALAVAQTPEQVVRILRYVLEGQL